MLAPIGGIRHSLNWGFWYYILNMSLFSMRDIHVVYPYLQRQRGV